jgi:hypothetical protein
MEKLKLLKSVAFPAALALSAAIHVVAFQAFDVKTAGNAPHREVYEVRIAYMKSDLEAFEAETRAPLPVEASPADTQVLLPAEVRPRKRRS